jgi:hypothetical protein
MTARDGDLMLGSVLEHMCDRNDHETVLQVLQVLGKTQRAGYLTANELIMCLIYCGNRFAEQNNGDFFSEYVHYMPDINRVQDTTRRFTPLCKSYYFAYKHAESWLNDLQNDCMLIDTKELLDWFKTYIVTKRMDDKWQLRPLFDKVKLYKDTITNVEFKQISDKYVVPVMMKSGARR